MKTLQQLLGEGVHDAGIFKVLYVIGAPGSGKTTIVERATAGLGYKRISSDKIFELMAGEVDLSDNDPALQDVRKKARRIMYREKENYVKSRLPIIIDTPGYGDYVQKDILFLESKGYEVFMIVVDTKLETALDRNQNRTRKVPPQAIKDQYSSIKRNFKEFSNMIAYENFAVINNDVTPSDETFTSLWKQVKRFTSSPPKHAAAKEWIARKSAPKEPPKLTPSGLKAYPKPTKATTASSFSHSLF